MTLCKSVMLLYNACIIIIWLSSPHLSWVNVEIARFSLSPLLPCFVYDYYIHENLCWTNINRSGSRGGSWGADDPPFQGWISCTSLLCLAKQPALPPSLQLMNLDQLKTCLYGEKVGFYRHLGLFVSFAAPMWAWFSRKWAWSKFRARFARDYLVYDPPPTWYPGSAPD